MTIDIEASKFYIASDHKEEITAAYNSVFNKGLKIQHPEQLYNGDDAKEDADEAAANHQKALEDNVDVSKHESFHKPASHVTVNAPKAEPANFTPAESGNVQTDTDSNDISKNSELSDSSLNESSDASSSASLGVKPEVGVPELQSGKQNIEAQTVLYQKTTTAACTLEETKSSINSIIGLLNAKDDTSGVRLAQVKDMKELWIYYQDDKNLNDVMEPVIKLLCQSDYSWLSFSRLARKDNAIVFDINSVRVENDDRQPEAKET